MPDQHVLMPAVSDVVVVGDSGTADSATVREVFRARHALTVSVMERPHAYRAAYSLGDIHRLTFLSHEERTAVQQEWHAWHRKYVALTWRGVTAWMTAAAVSWLCWSRASELATAAGAALGLTVGAVWSQGAAAVMAVGLLATLPALLATLSASARCDAYLRGYADGLTRGVNRALRITPDDEREMWDELREAEIVDAKLRRAPPTTEPLSS